MIYLKQSTAVTLLLGPFVDSTDGNTDETGLTISQADVRLSKNGGNMAQKNESTACTHDELGYYTCPLDTTDTNTLGILKIMVHESGALPVWEEAMVLTDNAYDTLCSTDAWDVNVTHVAGTSQTANDNGADINAILEDTGTTLPATLATIDGNVDDILVDTGTTLPATLATIDGIVDDILVDTGTTIPGTITTIDNEIAVIDGIVDDILVDTGTTIPATLTSMSGATFDTGTDSLEAIRNRGDAAWVTGAGGSAPTVEEIRAEIDSNSTQLAAILTDTAEIGAAGAGLTAVPWNAAWDAEVQSECTDALNAYDPPTRGELTTDTNSIITQVNANETKIDIIDTNVDSILEDTGTTLPATLATIDGIADDILVDTGTTLPATLATITGYLDTEISAILEDTGTTIPGLIAALNDLSADDVWDEVLEGALTGRQIQRILLAVLAGITTDDGAKFRDVGDTKDRVVATLDGDGNRTAMTLDGS